MPRDSGWIQLYCEDNQEVYDSVLASFRLAEDHRILLPVMICQDAFVLSHTMMMTEPADGKLAINIKSELSRAALERYLKGQGSFTKGDVDVDTVRAAIENRWEDLQRRASA